MVNKEFPEVWTEIQSAANDNRVIYTHVTRKMQVIDEVTENAVTYTDDPTHKKTPVQVPKEDFAKIWHVLAQNGRVSENEIANTVGLKRAEFIITLMPRLGYIGFDETTKGLLLK
jgi:hypothetical protein